MAGSVQITSHSSAECYENLPNSVHTADKMSTAADSKLRDSTVNYDASKVNKLPFRPLCSLCSFTQLSDHPMFKCNKFSTPKDKIDELIAVDICIKCW